MTDEAKQAIDILQKEILCVSRECDTSRCRECDLVMPDREPIIKAYKVAIKALKQRWIPVSERLPEDENKDYLVCLDDGYIATIMYDGFGKWLIDDAEIIAWIPLPEPYTED